MPEKQGLYFIAFIPQQELCDDITGFKKDFAIRFNSRKALSVIPHITLKTPFKLPADKRNNLLTWFNNLKLAGQPFNIELNGFGSFRNKRNPVVFINPVMNSQLLSLQKQLIISFENNFPSLLEDVDSKFTPHITIAYRDLEPARFIEAWQEYKSKAYHAIFEVKGIHLLQHDSRQWNIISTYLLKNDPRT